MSAAARLISPLEESSALRVLSTASAWRPSVTGPRQSSRFGELGSGGCDVWAIPVRQNIWMFWAFFIGVRRVRANSGRCRTRDSEVASVEALSGVRPRRRKRIHSEPNRSQLPDGQANLIRMAYLIFPTGQPNAPVISHGISGSRLLAALRGWIPSDTASMLKRRGPSTSR